MLPPVFYPAQVRHPYVAWSYTSVLELTESSFLLTAVSGSPVAGLELKGQFIETELAGAPCLLFMGSVRISCLEEMKRMGLYLSEIPPHDMARDFVLLAEQRQVEADLKEKFEVSAHQGLGLRWVCIRVMMHSPAGFVVARSAELILSACSDGAHSPHRLRIRSSKRRHGGWRRRRPRQNKRMTGEGAEG